MLFDLDSLKTRRKVRNLLFVLLFCFGVVIINQMLTFLLMPNVSFFRQVAYDATKEKNVYDMVCFGSSEEFYSFNSIMATDMLEKECYNMGTSGTTVAGGVYSAFRLFMKNQSPSMVIIMVGPNSMISEGESEVAYSGIAPYTGDLFVNLEYFFRMCMTGGELRRMFPWSVNKINTLDELRENVQVKMSEAYLNHNPSVLPSESLVFKGRGYCPQLPGENNDNVIVYSDVDVNEEKLRESSEKDKELRFNEMQTRTLQKMINQAQDSGADVMVVMSPVPKSRMVESNSYYNCTVKTRDFVKSYGAEYVDMNIAKQDFYDPQPYEYVDASHVLEVGADRYTKALCEYIIMERDGRDTSNLFYEDWDDFVNSYDWSIYEGLN